MASLLRARVALRSPSPLGSITAAASLGFEEKISAPFAALTAPGRARLLLNPAISRVAFFLGERVFWMPHFLGDAAVACTAVFAGALGCRLGCALLVFTASPADKEGV